MQAGEEERPRGLKPRLISEDLRGPEGPLFRGAAYAALKGHSSTAMLTRPEGALFHGDTDIYDFFRKL